MDNAGRGHRHDVVFDDVEQPVQQGGGHLDGHGRLRQANLPRLVEEELLDIVAVAAAVD